MIRLARLVLLAAGMLLVVGRATAASAPPAPLAADRISVAVTGQGPDVVLMPGLASSGRVWDAAVAHLAPGHRVHVVTLAGFGTVPAGANESGSLIAPVTAALHAYLAANGIRRAALVGHSFGGLLALKLASDHPDDVGRLMLVEALPWAGLMYGNAPAVLIERQARALRDRMLGQTQAEYAADQPAQVAALVRSRGAAADAAIADAAATDHRVAAQALYEDLTSDLRPALARIAVPTTILYAWDSSRDYPAEMADALYRDAYRLLAAARFERIDGSYLFIQLDQPALFAEQLDTFLR